MNEVLGDPDDNLNIYGEQDLDVIGESFVDLNNSVVISTLETLSLSGMCTDSSVKDDVMAQTDLLTYFT